METEKFQAYLSDRYQREIDWYDRRSAENKCWYSRLQWGLIIFSAASPILFALSGPIDRWEKWLAVGVAFLAAVFTSLLKAFQYQEHWVNYRTTAETLKKEIHHYCVFRSKSAGVSEQIGHLDGLNRPPSRANRPPQCRPG